MMGPFYLYDIDEFNLIDKPELKDRKIIYKYGLEALFDLMRVNDKRVIFIIDNPELDSHPKNCIDRPHKINFNHKCGIKKDVYQMRNKEYRDIVISTAKNYKNVEIFDSTKILCDKIWCYSKINNQILYSDRNHLSKAGALLVSSELTSIINKR